MLPTSPASSAARAFVRWTLRYGKAIWITALLLAVPATAITVRLYMHLRSEVEELLPPGKAANGQAVLLAAIALAHELEQERARPQSVERRAKDMLKRVLGRIDDAIDCASDQ